MTVWRIVKTVILVVIIGGIVSFLVWAHIVSPADQTALNKVKSDPYVRMVETPHSFVLRPTGTSSSTGLVFIPGAKVDPKAYAYKLSALTESLGMTIIITKPYLNLAILDRRPFASFTNDVNGIDRWFIGGHSLGGTRACAYAADSHNSIKGLILLASYCTDQVSVPTLSLRGKNDGLVSDEDIRSAESMLTVEHQYYEIENANHASFGDYGVQSGDGQADITSDDMRQDMLSDVANWLP